MTGWVLLLLLLVDLLFVFGGLHVLLRRVLPLLDRLPYPALISDVWAPLALLLPGLFLAGPVGESVAAHGWVPVASAVCAGALGAALAFLKPSAAQAVTRPRPGAWVIWVTAGLLMLLLGAAHELTIWTGQCFFAVAAVILWLNTPVAPRQQREDAPSSAQRTVASGMLLAFVCALTHGLLALLIGAWSLTLAAILVVIYVVAGCVGAALFAGPGWALRVVGWTAALGILLGAGLLSLLHLLPQAAGVVLGLDIPLIPRVAHGFGVYSIEAVLLIVMAVVGWMLPHVPRLARVTGGVLIALAAIVITIMRLIDLV